MCRHLRRYRSLHWGAVHTISPWLEETGAGQNTNDESTLCLQDDVQSRRDGCMLLCMEQLLFVLFRMTLCGIYRCTRLPHPRICTRFSLGQPRDFSLFLFLTRYLLHMFDYQICSRKLKVRKETRKSNQKCKTDRKWSSRLPGERGGKATYKNTLFLLNSIIT